MDQSILFFDDFKSSELDRSIWNVEITGKVFNKEQQAYIDSPETVYIDIKEEALVIHPRFHQGFRSPQGKAFDFVSGRINTRGKLEFIYGCVSARIRVTPGKGLWPAFWMLGKLGRWPRCGEIDVMEGIGEPDWVSVAVHGTRFSGEKALTNRKYFHERKNAAAWHIYSVECNPDKGLIFKIDDELIFQVTRPMVEFFSPWVFDSPKYLILNFALGGIYPFKTNGICAPYYGISEETVDIIRNGEAKMSVDWVRVSRI